MTDEQRDQINEVLGKFHYESFIAGVCYERDEWPQSEEEWLIFNRGIQSETVGEHYEGFADELISWLEEFFWENKK